LALNDRLYVMKVTGMKYENGIRSLGAFEMIMYVQSISSLLLLS